MECIKPECTRKVHARGMCSKHYDHEHNKGTHTGFPLTHIKPTTIKLMNQCEIGWLAGIIEGEGNFYRDIRVAMTDNDVVSRLQDITGVGYVSEIHPKGFNRKPIFCWTVSRKSDITHILASILPLLGDRRKLQAQTMMDRRNI